MGEKDPSLPEQQVLNALNHLMSLVQRVTKGELGPWPGWLRISPGTGAGAACRARALEAVQLFGDGFGPGSTETNSGFWIAPHLLDAVHGGKKFP